MAESTLNFQERRNVYTPTFPPRHTKINLNVEFIIDSLFVFTDRLGIISAGQQLINLIMYKNVSSWDILELIERKINQKPVISFYDRGLAILHFIICACSHRFRLTVLSVDFLDFIKNILETPYTTVIQRTLENLSIWLEHYSSEDLTIDERKYFWELEWLTVKRTTNLKVEPKSFSDILNNLAINIIQQSMYEPRVIPTLDVEQPTIPRLDLTEERHLYDRNQTIKHTNIKKYFMNSSVRQSTLLDFIKEAEVEANDREEKSKKIMENNPCIICMDEQREYASIPCGHKLLCKTCFAPSKYVFSNCPICRKKLDKLYQIFD